MSSTDNAATRACQNCGTPMLGDHCYACGQPVKGLVRHFGSIVGDFVDSVFDLDSRLLRTLPPLLFRPGFLTRQYLAGHRVRYVSPVRLFVFLCVLAFFVVRFAVDLEANIEQSADVGMSQAQTVGEVEAARDAILARLETGLERADNPGARIGLEAGMADIRRQADQRIEWLRARDAALARGEPAPPEPRKDDGLQFNGKPWHPVDNPIALDLLPASGNALLNRWAARAQGNVERVAANPRLLVDAFLESLPSTLFVLLPVFALLLKFAYLFRRRLYMEHLIVALHSHAFLCAALLLLVGLTELRDLLEPQALTARALGLAVAALALWMPLYLWLMQKRVYAQGVIATTLKFAVLGLCYVVLLSLGAALNLMVSLVAL